jgi:hypothetical protein
VISCVCSETRPRSRPAARSSTRRSSRPSVRGRSAAQRRSRSAGTGKTRVLVTRYLNLLNADVDPANILAITFTRKAAADMHERIVALGGRRTVGGGPALADLRDRLGRSRSRRSTRSPSLLREFLGGGSTGFEVADEPGAAPRGAIDRTLRICLPRGATPTGLISHGWHPGRAPAGTPAAPPWLAARSTASSCAGRAS